MEASSSNSKLPQTRQYYQEANRADEHAQEVRIPRVKYLSHHPSHGWPYEQAEPRGCLKKAHSDPST